VDPVSLPEEQRVEEGRRQTAASAALNGSEHAEMLRRGAGMTPEEIGRYVRLETARNELIHAATNQRRVDGMLRDASRDLLLRSKLLSALQAGERRPPGHAAHAPRLDEQIASARAREKDGNHGGTGVIRVSAGGAQSATVRRLLDERARLVRRVNREAATAEISDGVEKVRLPEDVVLQAALPPGKNSSFSLFLPRAADAVYVLAVGDQLTCPTTHKFLGCWNHPVTQETVAPLVEPICGLVSRVRERHPDAFGVLMADYWLCDDGRVVMFDLGLRPSGNTPGALIRTMVEERAGFTPVLHSDWRVETGGRPAGFDTFAKALGALIDPGVVLAAGRGLVPFGYNPQQRDARLVVVGSRRSEIEAVQKEALRRLNAAFGTARAV
jgi:hypothetical protein